MTVILTENPHFATKFYIGTDTCFCRILVSDFSTIVFEKYGFSFIISGSHPIKLVMEDTVLNTTLCLSRT